MLAAVVFWAVLLAQSSSATAFFLGQAEAQQSRSVSLQALAAAARLLSPLCLIDEPGPDISVAFFPELELSRTRHRPVRMISLGISAIRVSGSL